MARVLDRLTAPRAPIDSIRKHGVEVMSVQNTHDIPGFYYVFVPFHIVISVVIALYLIYSFLCTTGE